MKVSSKIVAAWVFLVLYGSENSLMAVAEVKQAAIQVSPSWNEAKDNQLSQNGALTGAVLMVSDFPERQWWEKFNDQHLNQYVSAAIQGNPTLNSALHRITEARALTSQAISRELPAVNFNPAFYRVGLPDNVKNVLPVDSPLRLYNLPLNASYELDFWGRNLDGIRSAKRQAESAELQSRSVLNTVTGEVASAYFNLLRMDALIEAQQNNLTLLKRVSELKISRHEAGLTAYDEALRANRDVAEAESSLSDFKHQQAVFAHQLSILTGTPPASAAQLERASLEALNLSLETEVGSPGELLTRRPDVMAQEKMLESASIDVRVARKAFLPSLNIGAMVGSGALGFRNLWDWGNIFNMQSIALSQPIFQGGRLRAELNYRKAKQKEELEHYRQTVLTAMKDVEDSLSSLKSGYDRLDSGTKQVTLTRENLRLIDSRYQQGLIPKLDLLQAESELIRYRQTAIQSKADTAIAMISLYKALGGGY